MRQHTHNGSIRAALCLSINRIAIDSAQLIGSFVKSILGSCIRYKVICIRLICLTHFLPPRIIGIFLAGTKISKRKICVSPKVHIYRINLQSGVLCRYFILRTGGAVKSVIIIVLILIIKTPDNNYISIGIFIRLLCRQALSPCNR